MKLVPSLPSHFVKIREIRVSPFPSVFIRVHPWLNFCFLLSALCFSSPAATITGNLTDISMSPFDTKLIFTPTNEVLVSSSGLSAGPPKILDTSSGSFSILLDTGYYTVSLPAIPWRRPFLITVPETTATLNITNLIGQIPYVSTNCMVKITPWDFVPGGLDQKLGVMGSLAKFLITNFSSGAVTLILSNNPGSGPASALDNDNIHIGSDGTCGFGLLGTPFHISAAGNFDRLSIGDEGEHLFNADGSLSLAGGNLTSDPSGNLSARSLTLPADLEIFDTTHGVILRSPGGTRYRIKVADDGTLSTEAL
jgi:hypothetical protein